MMHTRVLKALTVTGALLLAAIGPAMAAPGAGGGGGGGGSGGGGGGESTTGSLYSDLVIALRAEDGTPILEKYVVPETEEAPETIEYCVQPVSYEAVPGVTKSTNPVDGRDVWVLPLQGEWIGSTDPLPVAEIEACDPWPQYAMFVSEVEMERLNLSRTADEVIARKLADVALKLGFADEVALEATGRISYDDATIDASPENAAMYQSLMKTGTIPGLKATDTTVIGPPTQIGPDGGLTNNSRFNAWELAAMTIGAAASKSTPLTIDAVQYYNRVIGFPAEGFTAPAGWPIEFNRPIDPSTDLEMATGEQFVDYSGFTYNRADTFKGSVTWLDVPTLTWQVDKIIDRVPFTDLTSANADTQTLTGIRAFAQLADDVRALCNFIPDNTFLPGFYMDVPGIDTTDQQNDAITLPAVDLGTLPANVFQTDQFQVTASLLNPWGGKLIEGSQLRITIDASAEFVEDDVTAISVPDAQAIPFDIDLSGDLVGIWGPELGFPVAPGYNVSTTFDVTVDEGAPVGAYNVKLELIALAPVAEPIVAVEDTIEPEAVVEGTIEPFVAVEDTIEPEAVVEGTIEPFVAVEDVIVPAVEPTVRATDTGMITVNANVATVLWGEPLPKLATQGVVMTIPLRVYSPAAGTGQLTLTVSGPGDYAATPDLIEATRAGDVKIFGSTADAMVSMPLELIDGKLVGTWDAALVDGYAPVTWYATVAEGALVGNYQFGVTLDGGNSLVPLTVSVSAPASHGEQPPGSGDDSTDPIVTIDPVGTLASDATFTLTALDASAVTFECMLTTNGVDGNWAACTSPKSYTGLQPGTYKLSVIATDAVGNESFIAVLPWTVTTTPPAVTSPPAASSGSGTPGAAGTAQPGPQASAGQGEPVQAGTPAQATARTAQTARIRAQASGRFPVGTVIVLARQPVKTSAGVTVRWRATTETRKMCTVKTVNGKSTATLVKRGTCRVVGWAPAPSANYLPFTVQRTYRAVR